MSAWVHGIRSLFCIVHCLSSNPPRESPEYKERKDASAWLLFPTLVFLGGSTDMWSFLYCFPICCLNQERGKQYVPDIDLVKIISSPEGGDNEEPIEIFTIWHLVWAQDSKTMCCPMRGRRICSSPEKFAAKPQFSAKKPSYYL